MQLLGENSFNLKPMLKWTKLVVAHGYSSERFTCLLHIHFISTAKFKLLVSHCICAVLKCGLAKANKS